MTSRPTNAWCQAAGIDPPILESVVGHRQANYFSLLIVALLERGEPMTLPEVAARLERAGVAGRDSVLRSLKRCKPGRAPMYREGELYHLDPHDDDLGLWVFRLDLRPPRAPVLTLVPEPEPLPGPEVALTEAELDEAWTGASLWSWSVVRVVVAVLDAAGHALPPAEVVAAVARRTPYKHLSTEVPSFGRRGSAVVIEGDGRWAIAEDATQAVTRAREVVRACIAEIRARHRPDPGLERIRAEAAREQEVRRAELARLRRAILVGFPPDRPRAVVLLDVGAHALTTFVDEELDALRARLDSFDVLGAVDVRALLRSLGVEPGARRLAELGPPKKTTTINKRGRTLKITTELLVRGTCGISRPFGDPEKLAAYLAKGDLAKLRARLEADAKSLHALYAYGRLHGTVRLRWGFLDEDLPVAWVRYEEPRLYALITAAHEANAPLQVVVGNAPGWSDPWSRAIVVHVAKDATGWRHWLVTEAGRYLDARDVQRARPASLH